MRDLRLICALIAVLLCASGSVGDQLYSKNKKANSLYKKGEYREALKMYDDLSVESPAEPKVKMNKGSTQYQLKDFEKAEEAYNAAAAGCKDKRTLGDLYYNLGNIQYMQGEALAEQGKQEAMEKYKAALGNYIKSLDARPHDRDAKWNLQLASARIKQMQNPQNQQKQNDKNNKDQKQDQNQKQDQQKDQKQNQDDKKDKQNDQRKKDENQDKKDQQSQQNDNQREQKPEPTPSQKKEEMKKEDAKKLLQLYSDDDRDLNKKPEQKGIAAEKRSNKDW
jgi:Ca-activated chloride channel homolog